MGLASAQRRQWLAVEPVHLASPGRARCMAGVTAYLVGLFSRPLGTLTPKILLPIGGRPSPPPYRPHPRHPRRTPASEATPVPCHPLLELSPAPTLKVLVMT